MNIKSRVKKIAADLYINSEYCQCGTAYFNGFVAGSGSITTEMCPDCELKVKPQTIAEFVKRAEFETELILHFIG